MIHNVNERIFLIFCDEISRRFLEISLEKFFHFVESATPLDGATEPAPSGSVWSVESRIHELKDKILYFVQLLCKAIVTLL